MANSFSFGSAASTGVLTPLGQAQQYPLINGFRPSWASIEIRLIGRINYAIQSISYKAVRTRKETRGTSVDPLGKTRGSIKYDAKIKILLAESAALFAQLGQLDPTGNNAFGDIQFTMTVQYNESSQALITDTIQGCSIDTVEQDSSEGVDDIVREHDLTPTKILFNGQPMSSQPLGAPNY